MNLNGRWDLYYALETQKMEDSPEYLRRYGEKIPAEVPGNVELDLERAGREPDPFYAENIYRFLSNISNDMYNEDSERASIRLENFKEDLERLNH